MTVRILAGHVLDKLADLPDESCHMVLTSPPYYGLRAYGTEPQVWPDGWRGELGQEPTVALYIAHLVAVFGAVRRVLRPDGVLLVNLGDSYASGAVRRAPAYGNGGTMPQGSTDRDSTSIRLCDGCRAALPPRIARTDNPPAPTLHGDSPDPSPARMESAPSHPPTPDSSHPTPTQRSSGAIRDHEPSPTRVDALPPVSPASTLAESFPRHPGACSHCDNCGACLDVLGSPSRDAALCARNSACTCGIGSPSGTSARHTSGMACTCGASVNPPYIHAQYTTPKPKDLMLVPDRFRLAMQADGWYVRSKMPWVKRNCMPESAKDRPVSAVEDVMLFTKSARYFWDAEAVKRDHVRLWDATNGGTFGPRTAAGGKQRVLGGTKDHKGAYPEPSPTGRNFRTSDLFFDSLGLILDEDGDPLALDVNPAGFKEAHFATFPPKLVRPLIQAGTSEKGCCAGCGAPWVRVLEKTDERVGKSRGGNYGGILPAPDVKMMHGGYEPGMRYRTIDHGWSPSCPCPDPGPPIPCTVLDCFGGAGTTGMVADQLGRDAILIDLNAEYAEMSLTRVRDDCPMFTQVEVS